MAAEVAAGLYSWHTESRSIGCSKAFVDNVEPVDIDN